MAEAKKATGTQLAFTDSLRADLTNVSSALPSGFNIERFTQNALALLNDNTNLQDFAKKVPNGLSQIKANMMKAAYLGLDFMSKEAHLVPFQNTLNFMIDYRGAEKLCKRYSIKPISEIVTFIVREGDVYEVEIRDNQTYINFKPKRFNNGKIEGACSYAKFTDGSIQYDEMSLEELENTRSHSRAKNSPAWASFTSEMYKKTVLHRLCKHITIDFENAKQTELFNEDVAIETEPIEIRNNAINQNANSVDFEEVQDAEVKPVPVEEVEKMVTPFQ